MERELTYIPITTPQVMHGQMEANNEETMTKQTWNNIGHVWLGRLNFSRSKLTSLTTN
jgi:hypothetical protein